MGPATALSSASFGATRHHRAVAIVVLTAALLGGLEVVWPAPQARAAAQWAFKGAILHSASPAQGTITLRGPDLGTVTLPLFRPGARIRLAGNHRRLLVPRAGRESTSSWDWLIGRLGTARVRSIAVRAHHIVRLDLEPGRTPRHSEPAPPVTNRTVGPVATACSGVRVDVAQDPAALVASYPPGTTFCFSRGTYRLRAPIRPKPGDRLIGRPGATLSGAIDISDRFVPHANRWVAAVQPVGQLRGSCFPRTYISCLDPIALFWDGRSLRQVDTPSELGAGNFFYNRATGNLIVDRDPVGHHVEVSHLATAISATAPDVVVRSLSIRRFGSTSGTGALVAGPGWRVVHDRMTQNSGAGICAFNMRFPNRRVRILRNRIDHNGQLGLCGHGFGIMVRGNQIDHNNTAHFSPNWEAGGAKWVHTYGLRVRGNLIEHNFGHGLWMDIENHDTVISRNKVSNNALTGIVEEISADATIRRNVVLRNGLLSAKLHGFGAGIFISNSSSVVVRHNLLRGNRGGIVAWQRDRGPTHMVKNILVKSNSVVCSGKVGAVHIAGPRLTTRALHFIGNDHVLISDRAPSFTWNTHYLGLRGWRRLGFDRTGITATGCR